LGGVAGGYAAARASEQGQSKQPDSP